MKTPLFLRPFALATAVVALCAGCAKSDPATKPRPAAAGLSARQVATVTIYQPNYGDSSLDLSPTVALNGEDLVTLHDGKVFTVRLAPGTYKFEIDGEGAGELRSTAGEHYYFVSAAKPGNFTPTPVLGLVSPRQGREQIQGLAPVDRSDVNNENFR